MGDRTRGSTDEYGREHLLEQERLLSACVQAVDAWPDIYSIVASSVNRSSAIEHLCGTLGLDVDQAEAVLAMPVGAATNGAAELRRSLSTVRAELASAERDRQWQGPRGQFQLDDPPE